MATMYYRPYTSEVSPLCFLNKFLSFFFSQISLNLV